MIAVILIWVFVVKPFLKDTHLSVSEQPRSCMGIPKSLQFLLATFRCASRHAPTRHHHLLLPGKVVHLPLQYPPPARLREWRIHRQGTVLMVLRCLDIIPEFCGYGEHWSNAFSPSINHAIWPLRFAEDSERNWTPSERLHRGAAQACSPGFGARRSNPTPWAG